LGLVPATFLAYTECTTGTNLIIPSSNEASRQVELANIQAWADRNNLRLNCSKSCEVIFSDGRRRSRSVPVPELAPLPGITSNRCLKVLGVNIAGDFVSQHIQRLVTTTGQTVYTLRVLRSRGLSDTDLQHVYRSTVIARLMYAASAWRGFASTSDRQRIDSVINCARRNGYCASDLPSFEELCEDVDDELFNKVVRMPSYFLHSRLPPPSNASQKYNLQKRTHVLHYLNIPRIFQTKISSLTCCTKIHTRPTYVI